MPHINRVRLVNVKYNDAKNCYDDFIMNLEGKSATYDLKNGGGKSVMLLMMLQNVLPNTYLKSDRPLKNIFKGGDPNRTSHCLIEWRLDNNADYKYLLTGFCVRKKQEEEEQDDNNMLGVEYFNYCYLYNTQNSNDIKNIPLVEKTSEKKIVMSYEKLRQYLSNMRKENLPIQMFSSKKEYLKCIEYFGLISAEWKLINEINSGENNIEKYFKVNKTSRKLIENFLIKIIDNINMQNSSEIAENEDLAEALINIKDNLMKFKKESDNKKEYEETKSLFGKLKRISEDIENNYTQRQKIYKKAYETYKFYEDEKEKLQKQIEDENNQIEEYKKKYIELENQSSKLEIDKNYIEKEGVLKSQSENEIKLESLKKKRDELDNQIRKTKATNEYLEYKEKKDILEQKQIQIQKMHMNDSDIQKEHQLYGANYLRILNIKKLEEENRINILKIKMEQLDKEQKELEKQEKVANNSYFSLKMKLENTENQLKNYKSEESGLSQELTNRGYLEEILNLEESINKFSGNKQNLENEGKENRDKIETLKEKISDYKIDEEKIKWDIKDLEGRLELANNNYKNYEEQKRRIEHLQKTFNVKTLEELQINWKIKKENIRKVKLDKEINKQIKQKKMELIQKYDIAVPNEDIFLLKEKLQSKCDYITTGIEELTKMDDKKRKEILENTPWYIYSVFIDNESFNRLKDNGIDYDIQSLVPVANIEFLRNEELTTQEQNLIYPIAKEIYQNIDHSKLESYKKELESQILQLEAKIKEEENEENNLQSLIQECTDFTGVYNKEKIISMEEEIENLKVSIKEKNDFKKHLITDKENQMETIENLEIRNKNIVEQLSKLEDDIKWFENLKEVQNNIKSKISERENFQKVDKEIRTEHDEQRMNFNVLQGSQQSFL